MRTLLGPSRTSSSLHRMPSTSDALVVTRRHGRVGLLTARSAARDTRLAEHAPRIHLRAEGLCHAEPVRARRAAARERLPSYCEPASFHPRTDRALFPMKERACDRAPFRLLSTRAPRQAVLRASSRLAPSLATRPCDLPAGQDARCVQPTSATRTKNVYPYAVRSWLLEPLSRPGTPRANPRFARCVTRGPSVFTTPGTLRLRRRRTRDLVPSTSRLPVTSVGLFDPRRSKR